ncbi:PadR family transcriptional regulator [Spongisporangium articulatum]|uniref:PadR family transcriptional regulator n=1 Tax=Spongisporangium articulatum TaxID=3362603 RepID=A0ABW8AQB9_9ACTN
MTGRAVTPTPLYLLILGSLDEAPMHPYEIQRLAVERGKTGIHGVKRGSLYHAVARLEGAGLIEAAETNREGRRPERTVYRLTGEGSEVVRDWLVGLLRDPSTRGSDLVAALEYMALLEPAQVQNAFQYRVLLLDGELGALRAAAESIGDQLPRIFTIESELQTVLRQAERDWAAGVLEDLKSGAFAWSRAGLHAWAQQSPFANGRRRDSVEDGRTT